MVIGKEESHHLMNTEAADQEMKFTKQANDMKLKNDERKCGTRKRRSRKQQLLTQHCEQLPFFPVVPVAFSVCIAAI
jgi:hypothetical protein